MTDVRTLDESEIVTWEVVVEPVHRVAESCMSPLVPARPQSAMLNALRRCVPVHGNLSEVGFIGHVAGQSGVVTEDSVFHYRLAAAHRLKEIPQMRLFVVPLIAAVRDTLQGWLFAGAWFVPVMQ